MAEDTADRKAGTQSGRYKTYKRSRCNGCGFWQIVTLCGRALQGGGYAVTRIRTWVVAATTRSTNHYTITASTPADNADSTPDGLFSQTQ
ncbi:hypothetical protein RRG08_004006 [Elysia crispata]|uniref:Uncharacterized protein n=1 Tax=Elysia crispata TaxID=231223 RepID=A0AAE0Y5I4_9GAST|nr:hypothetical protein RRG08_004006 [Elysia crispata]